MNPRKISERYASTSSRKLSEEYGSKKALTKSNYKEDGLDARKNDIASESEDTDGLSPDDKDRDENKIIKI